MLLICRFAIASGEVADFLARTRHAMAVLTAQPGCLDAQLGRSPDDPDRWVLLARFESIVAYRRALSPFEVREHVVPLLAEALTGEPGAYELLATGVDGVVSDHASLLAEAPGTPATPPPGTDG